MVIIRRPFPEVLMWIDMLSGLNAFKPLVGMEK